MRVLHINTETGWRGGENQLRLLLEGLRSTDVESFVALRPEAMAKARLANLAPLIELPMRGGFAPAAARELAKRCDAHGIDLIDAHTANAHTIALMVKMLRPKLGLVVHRRVDFVPRGDPLNRWKYRTQKVDRYVAISSAIKDVLLGFGVAGSRITVVHSAVDGSPYDAFDRATERRELATAFGVKEGLVFLGNASALTAQKDYPTLLTAAKLLKDRKLPFHLFVAGDGALRFALERQRIELGLEHDVTFLGFVAEVPRFLAGLDAFVLSSAFEGLGTILLEAAHAGLCRVATRVGGVPEAVVDGETGLLVPPGDPEALASRLERVIREPELRAALGAAGQAAVRRDFSLGGMVGGNLEIYRQLRRGAGGPTR